MEYVYFKHEFIPKDRALIPIDDRSFRFGDGVFETILVANNKPYDITHHLTRLDNGLKFLNINLDTRSLPDICLELIQKNTMQEGYLRIIISRGSNNPSTTGYKYKDCIPYLIVESLPKPLPSFQPITLWVSEHASSIHLKSKVNSALLYVMAQAEAEAHRCDNALLLDSECRVCETASGNIFWAKDGVLYTPATDLPLVPGTIRQKLTSLSSYQLQEGYFGLEDLRAADEVFMTNIGTLVAPVTVIEPIGFSSDEHPIAQKCYQLIKNDILDRGN